MRGMLRVIVHIWRPLRLLGSALRPWSSETGKEVTEMMMGRLDSDR